MLLRTMGTFYFSLFFMFFLSSIKGKLQFDGSSGLKRVTSVNGTTTEISFGNFFVEKFHCLQVSVASSIFVSNYRECTLSCVNSPPCLSFNTGSAVTLDGKLRCELLHEDKYSANPGQLVRSQEFHHYSIKVFKREF